jgi:hypothetical protein
MPTVWNCMECHSTFTHESKDNYCSQKCRTAAFTKDAQKYKWNLTDAYGNEYKYVPSSDDSDSSSNNDEDSSYDDDSESNPFASIIGTESLDATAQSLAMIE